MHTRLRGARARARNLASRLTLAQIRIAARLRGEEGTSGEPMYWGLGIVGAIVVGAILINTFAPDLANGIVKWGEGAIGVTPPVISPTGG